MGTLNIRAKTHCSLHAPTPPVYASAQCLQSGLLGIPSGPMQISPGFCVAVASVSLLASLQEIPYGDEVRA